MLSFNIYSNINSSIDLEIKQNKEKNIQKQKKVLVNHQIKKYNTVIRLKKKKKKE